MAGKAYDAAYPPLSAMLARHPQIICAYTDGPHGYSRSQVESIHAGGAGVLANHERAVDQLLAGWAGGFLAAQDATAAVTAWGMPTGMTRAIHYSVDLSVAPARFPVIGLAFDAINAVHAGRWSAGCYGEGALIDYLIRTGRIGRGIKGWLSASSSFPGFNPTSSTVGLVQQVGTDVPDTDLNVITDAAALGVWWPAGRTAPSAESAPITMTIGDDDVQLIRNTASGECRLAYGGGTPRWLSPGQYQTYLNLGLVPWQLDAGSFALIIDSLTDPPAASLGQLAQIVSLLADTTSGAIVRLAQVQAAVAALKSGGGAALDIPAIAQAVRDEIAARPPLTITGAAA